MNMLMNQIVSKKVLTSIFLVGALASSSAFSQQIFLAGYQGLVNIAKSPITLIKNAKARKLFKNLTTEYYKSHTETETATYQCKKSVEVLAYNVQASEPTEENSLTFRNHPTVEEEERGKLYSVSNPFGYCWGHAMVTSKMNRIGIFRPNLSAPHKHHSRKWRKFYKKIIRNITIKNKARIIPGFKNLADISSDKYIRRYLALAVQKSWARIAITLKGISAGLKKDNTLDEKKELVSGITKRVLRTQFPQVIMHYLDENFTQTHIVVLYKDLGEIEPGIHRYCARDNNSEYQPNSICKNYLTINLNDDSPILYMQKKYYDLEGIESQMGIKIAHNEDMETALQVKSLSKLCKEENL
jgi:hypothetical protein